MEETRNVWRVGSSWGGSPIYEVFKKCQVVFFGNDSGCLGHYRDAKAGDLLAISAPNSKEVNAIAKMESSFSSLSEWASSYKSQLNIYRCNGNLDNTLICMATIIELNESDYYDSADYKRFYKMRGDEQENTKSLWKSYLTEKMNVFEKNSHFTLKELGCGPNFIKIPSVQRGLVWKPRQVELLWDSILRKFPIGSFVLYRNDNGFELLDGQQRYNAISLGFAPDRTDRARLWIDLGVNGKVRGSTRKFWVKAITTAHPWGFNNNDECTTLSASERRAALEAFGYGREATMANTDVKLEKCWPFKSICPIPLNILMDNASKSEDEFIDDCIKEYSDYIIGCPELENILKEKIDQYKKGLKALYGSVHDIENTVVPFSLLGQQVIEAESENEDKTEETNLEILFRRIASGGTPITQAELSYSAIKVYWPDIQPKCETIAESCMPAYSLAILAFRLYLIEKEKKWIAGLSINQIRQLSDNLKDKESINKLFNGLEDRVKSVNEWLSGEPFGVPNVLRTDLAKNYSDIYLLLLWIKETKFAKNNEGVGKYLTALAFFIKWFTKDPSACVREIFYQCQNVVDKNHILGGIYDYYACYEKGRMAFPCDPDILRKLISDSDFVIRWNQSYLQGKKYSNVWDIIRQDPWSQPDFLIYAEREHFNKVFRNFDPAKSDMWENHNRPWDYDHIIPLNWFQGRQTGDWRWFGREWINVVGNFSAIPFEENRSKRDRDDWSYYKQNEDKLLIDKRLYSLEANTRFYEKPSKKFATITFDRTIKIYEQVYSLVREVFQTQSVSEDSFVSKRKKLFSEIKKKLQTKSYNDLFVGYVGMEGLQYPVENEQDWANCWLSCGINLKDRFVAVSVAGNKEGNTIEVGVRRHPKQNSINDVDVWYFRNKNNDELCDLSLSNNNLLSSELCDKIVGKIEEFYKDYLVEYEVVLNNEDKS